ASEDRACTQQCESLSHCERRDPPVEGRRPRSRDGALLCPAQFPGAPAPLAAHDLIGINSNYQRLADILLSPAPDASKVQRLLALDLLPAPPIPRGYAIWSEGLLAEAFVCFPTAAFPALFERLRTATAHQDTSRLYKALTMWGDRLATAP